MVLITLIEIGKHLRCFELLGYNDLHIMFLWSLQMLFKNRVEEISTCTLVAILVCQKRYKIGSLHGYTLDTIFFFNVETQLINIFNLFLNRLLKQENNFNRLKIRNAHMSKMNKKDHLNFHLQFFYSSWNQYYWNNQKSKTKVLYKLNRNFIIVFKIKCVK